MGQQDGHHPNVVVFFTDQQRYDSTGVHGNPLGLTPNFDRLAQRGVHFANAFTCQPLCTPARACLQTGMYQARHGCFENHIPLPVDATTLAHCFRAAGYDTAYVGKWHLAGLHEPVPVELQGGYDYWLGANALELVSDAYDTVLYDKEGRAVRLPGYRVDALTDAAIRYIDAHRERPFFLFISYLEPHMQNHRDDYPAPDGYYERYVGRWLPPDLAALGGSAPQHIPGYWGMVKRLDEALGRLMDALKSLGLLEETIILFTSDHGCHFKTRNHTYKRSCHDSSVRIPAAMWGPGLQGRRIEQLVSLIDLAPTLLDAAGVPIPPQMQGRSAMPLVQGSAQPWPEEVFIQVTGPEMGRAVRTRRWKYCVVAPGKPPEEQASAERYVEGFLYDLLADPYELRNLVGYESHRQVAAVMRQRLIRRMVEAGEPEPIIEPAPSRAAGALHVSGDEANL